jgi:hypothetical protein
VQAASLTSAGKLENLPVPVSDAAERTAMSCIQPSLSRRWPSWPESRLEALEGQPAGGGAGAIRGSGRQVRAQKLICSSFGPASMAAIEVKGGQISVDDAQWYQSDRSTKRKIQSPVAQSQGSQHAFKNWISGQIGSRLTSRFAYLVAFPYTKVPQTWTMAGCPRTLILDQTDISAAELVRRAIEQEGGRCSTAAFADESFAT